VRATDLRGIRELPARRAAGVGDIASRSPHPHLPVSPSIALRIRYVCTAAFLDFTLAAAYS